MKIVIDIEEAIYKECSSYKDTPIISNLANYNSEIINAIANGTPQPEKRTEERTETHACDCISRKAAEEKLKKVVDEMALIFADIREKNVDDSVCGLCKYDCDHGIDGFANECPGFERDDCFKLKEEYRKQWTDLSDIPSVEPERKTGKWIKVVNPDTNEWTGGFKCSECDRDCVQMSMNFCANCGSRMEVDNGKN